MTNEEAKQEAIKKAYGEHWDKIDSDIQERILDNSGWTYELNEVHYKMFFDVEYKSTSLSENSRWRPLSLSKLEDNNGWIRIEPDGSNLPTDGFFKCGKKTVGMWFTYKSVLKISLIADMFKSGEITHYKPITPELKPIY